MPSREWVFLLFVAAAACSRGDRGAARAQPGIIPGSVAASVPAITPVLLPNGDEPDAVSMPSGVTVLPNGNVALVDQSTLKLHVFTAAGALVGSAGGKGEGPGEFTNVFGLVNIGGDSVASWDSALRRMSVFTSEPRFVRSERFEMQPGTPTMSRLLGRLADGRFVVLHQAVAFNAVSADDPMKVVETPNFLRVGPVGSVAGDSVEQIALAPTQRLVMLQPGGNSMSIVLAAFSIRQVAACEHGLLMMDDSSVTIYGQGLRMSRRYLLQTPISFVMTASDRKAMLEQNVGGVTGAVRARALAMLEEAQPDTIRFRSTPFIDADGRVLHVLPGRSIGARLYQRKNVDGTVLDTVHLPDAHWVFAADARTLVALRSESDTADAQVRIYRLPAPRLSSVTALGRCNSAHQY